MPSNDIYTSETKETIRPTRLYIKQHSITGLKYFGKTIKDPYTYLGSGTRWLNHINKHGKEFVETLWVSEPYTEANLIKEFAINFSQENNIVESSEWANLKFEDGLDGGNINPSEEFSEKCRQSGIIGGNKCKDNKLGFFAMSEEEKSKRKIKSDNTIFEKYGVVSVFSFLNKDPAFLAKRKESFVRNGHQQGKKNSQFGKIWITNGTISTKIDKNGNIPDGWWKGRKINFTKTNHQRGEKHNRFGKVWIYNLELKLSKVIKKEELPNYEILGWIKGRKMNFS